ncbi:cytochrome P450 2J4-like [Gigantopelta aegis]|uniref:cytochrome P450 2J4-like n=1 Tax=Gigantopelta aegis TaxID=1735272 RepID=UPI001B88A8F0|nr:cytochrome P450 2J4-like [Gigantopelta aegis]
MFEGISTLNVTTGLVCTMVCLFFWTCTRRPRGIPPGPLFTLPILGNLLQVGRNPITSFQKMRKQYGDVFSVYFGNRLVVVINGFENLKEAFVIKGDVFTTRPKTYVQEIVAGNKGVFFSNGAVWKEQRKFAVATLRHLGMGRNILEANIQEEATVFLEELATTRGQVTDITHLVHNAVSNIICTLVFGKRFQYNDPKFEKLLKVMAEDVSVSPLADCMPLLRFVPGDLLKINRTIKNAKMVEGEFMNPAIDEHLEHYDEDNIYDFISAYIKEMKLKESLGETNTSMDRENLRITITDLFLAGSESTGNAIRWFLLCLLHFPEIQEKCFADINRIVGRSRLVGLKDKVNLPFVEATIMETLRFGDITPMGGPHGVLEDTTLKGYRIPNGSIIVANIDSVLSDPNIWGDPEMFRPDRFLDQYGKVTKPEEFIPFFIGRRNCLGEALTRMELFLFISNMIQKFLFVKADDEPLPSLEGEFGLDHSPKPFKIRAILRD